MNAEHPVLLSLSVGSCLDLDGLLVYMRVMGPSKLAVVAASLCLLTSSSGAC